MINDDSSFYESTFGFIYSSKDLGALYYVDERHLGEKVQQASVLTLVVSWLKKAYTMVISIMC